ncbi:hypothetical protein F5880DRAFT_79530 [Lentinula raphanica]|nr:hypothetical protein F5880DRAFT_79530 [Lentinula raphanica]
MKHIFAFHSCYRAGLPLITLLPPKSVLAFSGNVQHQFFSNFETLLLYYDSFRISHASYPRSRSSYLFECSRCSHKLATSPCDERQSGPDWSSVSLPSICRPDLGSHYIPTSSRSTTLRGRMAGTLPTTPDPQSLSTWTGETEAQN